MQAIRVRKTDYNSARDFSIEKIRHGAHTVHMQNETIGQRIARLRKAMGLPRTKLGQMMGGVSHTTIYNVERDETTFPKQETLRKYAAALSPAMPAGVDPMLYLVYGIEPVAPPEAPLTDWAIANDPRLDDDAREYLAHALEYVRRTQTRKGAENAS